MEVTIEEWMMIKPIEETPKHILWASNVDQLFKMHMPSVYFYRANGSTNFFDANVLKDALRKVLVTFYPIAGRLRRDSDDGRAEIDCNGEGVVFVEANADTVLEELGDFTPSPELMKLVPRVADYVEHKYSSPPLLLVQVTYFKCGAVSLGVTIDHTLVDGASGIHFMNSWSNIARGVEIKIPPCYDRTLLRARDPPTPLFPHIEHQPSPTMKTQIKFQSTDTSTIALLKITRDQINLLKALCKEGPSPITYSSYEVLAAHIWRCACEARGLAPDQETKLSIATDGRSRLHPPLPEGYFGNAIFHMTPIAKSGELLKKPLLNTVQLIRETLKQVNDEYIRSALDFLELHSGTMSLIRGSNTFKCPNMALTSWCRLPIHEADFGWGKPMFMGPGIVPYEGLGYILPSPTNDASQVQKISLPHLTSNYDCHGVFVNLRMLVYNYQSKLKYY